MIALFNKVQARSDGARTGYIKPWKNQSIIAVCTGLYQALARNNEKIDRQTIYNLVHGSYTMEGVDLRTVSDVTDILFDKFK